MNSLRLMERAERELQAAFHALRNEMMSVAARDITLRLRDEAPDLSLELAFLAKNRDYMGCKLLVERLHEYTEAQANLRYTVARAGNDYESLFSDPNLPEYLPEP